MNKGKVYLIGAGPGDPELLTLKGKRCLGEADVIVGDYLADKRILKFAKPDAEYIYVGKKVGCHTMKNGETAVNTFSSTGNINIEDIKRQLLQDKDFLSRIEKSMTETGNQNEPEAESEDNENLDMDEDMMLAGLSMFI